MYDLNDLLLKNLNFYEQIKKSHKIHNTQKNMKKAIGLDPIKSNFNYFQTIKQISVFLISHFLKHDTFHKTIFLLIIPLGGLFENGALEI